MIGATHPPFVDEFVTVRSDRRVAAGQGSYYGVVTNTTSPVQSERRAEVVQAAIRAFARKGYGGTILADIGAEAGVSQPRISQIFGSKEAAFLAAHRAAAEEVLVVLERNAEPPYRMGKLGADYLPMLEQRPAVLMMVFQTLTSAYVPSIGAEARRTINEIITIVTERAGGSHADALDFLERGFFLHAMLAVGACDHAENYPAMADLLEEINLR